MSTLTILELEAAINHYRDTRPVPPNHFSIGYEVRVLANVYGMLIFNQMESVETASLGDLPNQLLNQYYDEVAPEEIVTSDTPTCS